MSMGPKHSAGMQVEAEQTAGDRGNQDAFTCGKKCRTQTAADIEQISTRALGTAQWSRRSYGAGPGIDPHQTEFAVVLLVENEKMPVQGERSAQKVAGRKGVILIAVGCQV